MNGDLGIWTPVILVNGDLDVERLRLILVRGYFREWWFRCGVPPVILGSGDFDVEHLRMLFYF